MADNAEIAERAVIAFQDVPRRILALGITGQPSLVALATELTAEGVEMRRGITPTIRTQDAAPAVPKAVPAQPEPEPEPPVTDRNASSLKQLQDRDPEHPPLGPAP